ncbi:MAG TPA: class I SAM-dependent methyltransferase [Acidiphilium sp.]|nr:class I SAM-dependent methyltransferase [Acidiphilium sp.]HQU23754.1 class I SAM-dependent methyltransferase [Acidiphilium sp.]
MGESIRAQDRDMSRHAMDADDVRQAYRRWAGVYDAAFGAVSRRARTAAVAAVNAAPGSHVLEVGVGTGLALPLYRRDKRIVGIDLSTEMLERARLRVQRERLDHVSALLELDAQDTGFETGQFDVAVAMFVASVVPDPRALARELQRVVRPGGLILFVNHFAIDHGLRGWVERLMTPASRSLGWHPDFTLDRLFPVDDAEGVRLVTSVTEMPPLGIFQLVSLINR